MAKKKVVNGGGERERGPRLTTRVILLSDLDGLEGAGTCLLKVITKFIELLIPRDELTLIRYLSLFVNDNTSWGFCWLPK